MKLADNYPIYLNPNFNEILELAQAGWDTIRICVESDTGDILLASGYGNTHTSIARRYKIINRRGLLDSFLLYKEGNIAYFNTEDMRGGREKHRSPGWEKYFSQEHEEAIKDLIRESNLTL